jgi:phosphoglycerate kinase
MKTIRDIEYVDGVKVLVRADFNVPIKHGAVGDDFRIRAALPTIDFLTNKGAVVILISHLESNDGENPSLAPIAKHLEKLGRTVTFIKDVKHAHEIIEAKMSEKKVGSGMIVLFENLRFSDGEKDNDPTFAKELASLADVYVNEAFPVSHRAHASIVGIPKFLPSYAGLQFEKEVSHLSKAFSPGHPFVFVLGGAKFDTKLPLIARFSTIADIIFLGGALGNDALLAKGISVGASKISSGNVDISAMVSQPNIIVPIDATIQDHSAKDIDAIGAKDAILDAGPKTLALVGEKIRTAKFILWNGPLGPYEDGYVEGTKSVANMIADRTQADSSVVSMVGGGDTLAAIANLGIEDKFTFVSSGGGAMLDFLAKGTLPGIEALGASS